MNQKIRVYGRSRINEKLKETYSRLYEIAGNCCELCRSNQGLSVHHIYPKSDPANCRDELWNMIVLCRKCHKHYKDEIKSRLIKTHLEHVDDFCEKWRLKVNNNWDGLIPVR